jgi:adenylosuccinate synthase
MIISADKIKEEMQGYDPARAEKYHRESARAADIAFKEALKNDKNQELNYLDKIQLTEDDIKKIVNENI